MGRQISLFSGYEQKENRTTNYVLLMLKLVYDESPALLAEVLSAVVGRELGGEIGVQFRQQEKHGGSVPDGLVVQHPFTLFIETKSWDWFYDDQLETHMAGLVDSGPGLKILLALSNFEEDEVSRFQSVYKIVEEKFANQVVFGATSFEQFLQALRELDVSPSLKATIGDFAAYLDGAGLLPNWKNLLDVINCVSTVHEIEGGTYLCPAQGGAYQHLRSRFFGMYANKTVSKVAEIEAVVDVMAVDEQTIKWVNGDLDREVAKERAVELLGQFRPGVMPTRVFILGPLFETDFRKDTRGGMLGSKQYFTVKAGSTEELADQLNGKTWSTWSD